MELLRLRELLKERGLTGKQFAESLNFSENTASNLINNKSFPSGKDLKAIADFLDVDIKDLFISTKDDQEIKDSLYIEREGKLIKVGEINLNHLNGG